MHLSEGDHYPDQDSGRQHWVAPKLAIGRRWITSEILQKALSALRYMNLWEIEGAESALSLESPMMLFPYLRIETCGLERNHHVLAAKLLQHSDMQGEIL